MKLVLARGVENRFSRIKTSDNKGTRRDFSQGKEISRKIEMLKTVTREK